MWLIAFACVQMSQGIGYIDSLELRARVWITRGTASRPLDQGDPGKPVLSDDVYWAESGSATLWVDHHQVVCDPTQHPRSNPYHATAAQTPRAVGGGTQGRPNADTLLQASIQPAANQEPAQQRAAAKEATALRRTASSTGTPAATREATLEPRHKVARKHSKSKRKVRVRVRQKRQYNRELFTEGALYSALYPYMRSRKSFRLGGPRYLHVASHFEIPDSALRPVSLSCSSIEPSEWVPAREVTPELLSPADRYEILADTPSFVVGSGANENAEKLIFIPGDRQVFEHPLSSMTVPEVLTDASLELQPRQLELVLGPDAAVGGDVALIARTHGIKVGAVEIRVVGGDEDRNLRSAIGSVTSEGFFDAGFQRAAIFQSYGLGEDAVHEYDRLLARFPDSIEALTRKLRTLVSLRSARGDARFDAQIAVTRAHLGSLNALPAALGPPR